MTCPDVSTLLSVDRDGGLDRAQQSALASHLRACADCAAHESAWRGALETLTELPRLEAGDGGIAARVLDRIELENRGPGLALLFRPAWAARPLILPSLVPAALVMVTVVSAAMALDRGSRVPSVTVTASRDRSDSWDRTPPSGTEANPLAPTSGVSVPRGERPFPGQVLEQMGEGTFFIETVVARDGSVSAVTLLGGDSARAEPVVDALRRERFAPAHFRGKVVAVSRYLLFSRMDVRAPLT